MNGPQKDLGAEKGTEASAYVTTVKFISCCYSLSAIPGKRPILYVHSTGCFQFRTVSTSSVHLV